MQDDVEDQHQHAELRQRADAVLADREGDGAQHAQRRQPDDEEHDLEEDVRGRARCRSTTGAAALAQAATSAAPNRIANSSTCRISPLAKASVTVVGMIFSRKSTVPCRIFAGPVGIGRHRGGIQRAGIDVHADAGLERIGQDHADQQRESRDDLEVDHRLDADAADLLQVAGLCDPQHDDAEHDGGDDHLDQLDEPVAKRLQRLREVRPYGADDDAQYKGHDDLEEKGLVERLAPGGLNRAVSCHLSAFPVSLRCPRVTTWVEIRRRDHRSRDPPSALVP